ACHLALPRGRRRPGACVRGGAGPDGRAAAAAQRHLGLAGLRSLVVSGSRCPHAGSGTALSCVVTSNHTQVPSVELMPQRSASSPTSNSPQPPGGSLLSIDLDRFGLVQPRP